MEDSRMLAADCVVISCCCQCLILQILVLALIKLPCKLIKKIKEFAKRKLNRRRRGERGSEMGSYEEIVRMKGEEYFLKVGAERERWFEEDGGCMEEAERVMIEFYQNSEFAFGSFWGRQGCWDTIPMDSRMDPLLDFAVQQGVRRHQHCSIETRQGLASIKRCWKALHPVGNKCPVKNPSSTDPTINVTIRDQNDVGDDFLRYQIIEMAGSFSHHT